MTLVWKQSPFRMGMNPLLYTTPAATRCAKVAGAKAKSAKVSRVERVVERRLFTH